MHADPRHLRRSGATLRCHKRAARRREPSVSSRLVLPVTQPDARPITILVDEEDAGLD